VIALMREAATRPHRILTSPAPNVLILSSGESAIELEMRFWIADAQHGVHNVKSNNRPCMLRDSSDLLDLMPGQRADALSQPPQDQPLGHDAWVEPSRRS
jgi:hypothetical protein